MRLKIVGILQVPLLVVYAGVYACAQVPSKQPPVDVSRRVTGDTAAVRLFVQKFYDWYAPMVERGVFNVHHPAFWAALNGHGLSEGLAEMLRGDSVAYAQPDDSRERLNSDPFLWSQDPCSPYVVEKVQALATSFYVTLFPACRDAGPLPQKPVLEVRPAGASFEIANVHYGKANLKAILCDFAMNDAKKERRPVKCAQ